MIAEAGRTIILYGDSGLGKTTNAVEFAKLAYETTHKPVRLITAEGSSTIPFAPLINVGAVLPLYLMNAKTPLPAIRRLSRGDWPTKDDKGAWKWSPWDGSAGAYIIEGLTSLSELLLENQRDTQRMMAEQREKAFTEAEGGENFSFAKSSMSNYDFVQCEMLRNLKAFGGLPVWRVLWTGHENKGEDEDTKMAIRGPGLVGKAKTGIVQKYCSVLLHLEGYNEVKPFTEGTQKLSSVTTRRRIWFTPHPDQLFDKITYPSKVTLPVDRLAELQQQFPHGYFEPSLKDGVLVNSLAEFIRAEDKLVQGATDKAAAWKAGIDNEMALQKQQAV